MFNFNRLKGLFARLRSGLKGQGIQVVLSSSALLVSILSLVLAVRGFGFLHQPSVIEVVCPEGYQEDIRQARELLLDMTKR
ncbi:MAG TPA: hypothetical protein VGE62_02925 [Candidatus Paceibacterota bacterium]